MGNTICHSHSHTDTPTLTPQHHNTNKSIHSKPMQQQQQAFNLTISTSEDPLTPDWFQSADSRFHHSTVISQHIEYHSHIERSTSINHEADCCTTAAATKTSTQQQQINSNLSVGQLFALKQQQRRSIHPIQHLNDEDKENQRIQVHPSCRHAVCLGQLPLLNCNADYQQATRLKHTSKHYQSQLIQHSNAALNNKVAVDQAKFQRRRSADDIYFNKALNNDSASMTVAAIIHDDNSQTEYLGLNLHDLHALQQHECEMRNAYNRSNNPRLFHHRHSTMTQHSTVNKHQSSIKHRMVLPPPAISSPTLHSSASRARSLFSLHIDETNPSLISSQSLSQRSSSSMSPSKVKHLTCLHSEPALSQQTVLSFMQSQDPHCRLLTM